ncbi:MAG TPA: hypothetical protein VF756_25300 [Thermoanaerobaculia bacterium]
MLPYPAPASPPLSRREQAQLDKALALLATGRGVTALTREGGMRVAGRGVFEALLARSWAVRFDNPLEMAHLAELALDLVLHLPAGRAGARRVTDLQARAWAELANAHRICGRYHDAGRALEHASQAQQDGTRDLWIAARILDVTASLLGSRGNLQGALRNLQILTDCHLRTGDLHLAARAQVSRAVYARLNGKPDTALRLLAEALPRLDERRDPELLAQAVYNRLALLVSEGQLREARAFQGKLAPWQPLFSPHLALRLRWLEALAAFGLGDLTQAESLLRDVQRGYQKLRKSLGTGLSSLDLALLLLRQQRPDEANEQIEKGLQILRSARECASGLHVLELALDLKQEVDAELLEVEIRYARRQEHLPGLPSPDAGLPRAFGCGGGLDPNGGGDLSLSKPPDSLGERSLLEPNGNRLAGPPAW